jgi:hypothetical protein
MKTIYAVSGRLTPEGTVELDERLPLPPGPVQVLVESGHGVTSAQQGEPFAWPSTEELKARKARLDTMAGCISDEEAQEILAVISQEFEQVNPDEWR